jgi:hypothetical protein
MKILPILSAIVIAIGCLLPWMQIGPLFSYNGIDHPVGAFLLVASVISSGIAFQNYTLESPKNTWIYIVLGLFGLFTAFGALYEVSSKAEEMAEGMEQIGEFIGQKSNISSIKLIGAGIYIISFGSLGLILSGLGIFDFEKRLTNTSYIDQFNSEFKELSQTKKCPDCAETIKKDARICRFCQYKFSEDDISKIDNLVKIEIDRKGVHKLHSLVKIEKK